MGGRLYKTLPPREVSRIPHRKLLNQRPEREKTIVKGRKRPTLPDQTSVIIETLEAEEVFGNFGPQLRTKFAVRGGKFSGFEFQDYVFGEDYAVEDLVGKRFMARVGLSGKNKDRNRLEFGTIGPDPNAGGEAG